jgi:hypothetical protein
MNEWIKTCHTIGQTSHAVCDVWMEFVKWYASN